jgi:hypothetical protein
MNRTALGLAVGAGYVLGRTKKMKLALALGSMVAGKRAQLGPRALADLVNQQLRNNPQIKEVGDQLRQDLRGVGKAASGALVERQIEGLAGRLHGRTEQARDRLSGAVPEKPDLSGGREGQDEGRSGEKADEAPGEEATRDEEARDEEAPSGDRAEARKRPARKAPAQQGAGTKPAGKKTAKAVKKAPGKKAPAKKTAAKSDTRRAVSGSAGERRR